MASTFDNDLRLEEMATGENAGSWGTKTNTNLELIADAFGYGTFTIADADTTLTMPDGSDTDNALRSLYLKISSSADLTTTRTLTLAPNTVSKLWFIENNTSGGQTITISQGSGANVSILNGQAKLVATDGAGAGAAVIDATQDLAIPDLFVDGDLTVDTDTLYVDSTNNRVGIGTLNPDVDVHIERAGTTSMNVVRDTNDVGGATVTLTSTRGTAVGDSTIVQDGDTLGKIKFTGGDGIDVASIGAEIEVKVDGTPGADDMPGAMTFKTTRDGNNTATGTMILRPDGAVYINTADTNFDVTNAGNKFQIGNPTVNSKNYMTIAKYFNDSSGIRFVRGSGFDVDFEINVTTEENIELNYGSSVNKHFEFVNNSSVQLVLNSNGKLGLGGLTKSDTINGFLGIDGANNNTSGIVMSNTFGEDVRFYFSDANEDAPFNINYSGTGAIDIQIQDSGRIAFPSGKILVGSTTTQPVGNAAGAEFQISGASTGSFISQYRHTNSANGPLHIFAKSRSASITPGTIVQENDPLGVLSFAGDDGVDVLSLGAQIRVEVDGTPGANDMPGRIEFLTTPDGAAAGTRRMVIDSAGNVSIGNTTDPDTPLFISRSLANDTIEPYITLESDTAAGDEANGTAIDFYPGGSKASLPNRYARIAGIETANSGGDIGLAFYTTTNDNTPSEAMRINEDGRLLIGTTTPRAAVGSNSAILIEGVQGVTASQTIIRVGDNSSGPFINFAKARGTAVGSVTIVQDGDATGEFRFGAADGTDLASETATIVSRIDNPPGANDTPGRLVFGTTSDGGTNAVERMRITHEGTMGLNVQAPDAGFHTSKLYAWADLPDSSKEKTVSGDTSIWFEGGNGLTSERAVYKFGSEAYTSAGSNYITLQLVPNNGDRSRNTGHYIESYKSFNGNSDSSSNNHISIGQVLRGATVAAAPTQDEYLRIDPDGIKFNGDTAAANGLNDYEEGTWTITNAGDATGVIAANAYGYYLKIGDLVYVQGVFQVTTSFTNATIGGLPYNPKNENTIVSSLHSLGLVRCSNICRFVQCSNGASTLNFLNDDGTARPPLTSTDPFRFSITYRAA